MKNRKLYNRKLANTLYQYQSSQVENKTTEVDHNYKHFMKNKQRIVHMLGKNRKCEFLRKNNHCCGSLRPLMQHMHGVISTCKALKK